MEFRDILVLVDNSPQCAARIDLAIYLAKKNKAHLTGLYIITHSHYSPLKNGVEKSASAARELFDSKTGVASIGAEWCCVDWPVAGVNMAEIVNLHAYHKDLVIVGQTDPGSKDNEVPTDLPERVIKGAGRPVLVVPYAGSFSTVGDHVMVAWHAGRESVRALNDAMPFIRTAGQVEVMAVSGRDIQGSADASLSAHIGTHLSRHNVKADIEQFATGKVLVGDVLLNTAWEKGCDLLVMGAFTYTSRGSMVLGPVARHILGHMSLPVLMSH